MVQMAYDLGVVMSVVSETTHINRQAAARKALPICWFDKEKTLDGTEALRNYRHVWDKNKLAFSEEPYHDWASDGSTAFEIIGRVWQNPSVVKDSDKPRFLHEMTAEEVFWPENNQIHTRERI